MKKSSFLHFNGKFDARRFLFVLERVRFRKHIEETEADTLLRCLDVEALNSSRTDLRKTDHCRKMTKTREG